MSYGGGYGGSRGGGGYGGYDNDSSRSMGGYAGSRDYNSSYSHGYDSLGLESTGFQLPKILFSNRCAISLLHPLVS